MSFDVSRFSFDPTKDYLGVVMQQGRVQLDSDWNEWQAEFARRIQAGTLDMVGRAVVPATTPNGFKITVSSGVNGIDLAIGAGRMYVDGLLVENHGIVAPVFTVVAVAGLANPGSYGVLITPQANATFNLTLYQVTGGVPAAVANGFLSNQTLETLQSAANDNNTLSGIIQIQDVASSGQPAPLPANALYMLALSGSEFQVAIPAVSQREWDPALAELSATPQPPGADATTIDFTQQPYLPGATIPATGESFLVYLDVWRRAITYLEDPQLIEKAVGVDTTGRLQTVWQVKLIPVPSDLIQVDCTTDIPAWDALLQPPSGWLTNGVVQSAPSGPCTLTPNTGYTGLENQLYRVEIHQPGPQGTATFKWSRDNGSVVTAVLGIAQTTNANTKQSASILTVQNLGRDQVLGFCIGDWIEITDDYLELNPPPNSPCGELHQIANIIASSRTIILADSVTSARFPLLAGGLTDPTRHTRIKRWNQSGTVYLNDGITPYCNLNGSTGAILVPPAGTTLILENGVTVTFGLNSATGAFNAGDFWSFAARTADGSIEVLTQSLTFGIHHHYTRLAMVNFSSPPNSSTDCRIAWPPASGSACGCTITLEPGDLKNTTLQSIVDEYRGEAANVVICLKPGDYALSAPLRLTAEHNGITLRACQVATAVLQAQTGQEKQFSDGVVVLDGVDNITLSGLAFQLPMVNFAPTTFAGLKLSLLDPDVSQLAEELVVSIGLRPVSCTNVTVEDCQFSFPSLANTPTTANGFFYGVGIFASGDIGGFLIQGNEFAGTGGFCAGFLLAPAVSIAPVSQPIIKTPIRSFTGERTAISAESANLALGEAAPGKAASVDQATNKASNFDLETSKVPTVDLVTAKSASAGVASNVLSSDLLASTAALNAAKFQTILNSGSSTPNLATQGGAVLLSSLDETVFKENTFAGMTIAALILAETETVEFVANEVTDGSQGGFWILSPWQVLNLVQDPQNLAVIGASVAMSYPLPVGDTSQSVNVSASPAVSVRLGTSSTALTDSSGSTWTPDVTASSAYTVTGGALSQPTPAPAINVALPDGALYQSERYGNSFSYTFNNLAQKYYQLTLKFAEIFYTNNATNKGVRVFNVSVNGKPVLTDFDIVADAGGAGIADDKVFPNILPNSSNQIVVQFSGTTMGSDSNAKISAIALDPQWNGVSSLNSVQSGELPEFFVQLAQLAEQGYASPTVPTCQLRVVDNQMSDLTATALLILGNDDLLNTNLSSLFMTGNQLTGKIVVQNASSMSLFLCATAIMQMSRCMISSNQISNEQTFWPNLSFYLDDNAVNSAQLAIMSNLFNGCVQIQPERYPASNTSVPSPMNTWAFLNTVTNCQLRFRPIFMLTTSLPKLILTNQIKI